MQKKIILLSMGALLFSTVSMAQVKPVFTFSLGSDTATFTKTTTNVNYFTGFPANVYVDTNSTDSEWVSGLYLAALFPFHSVWSAQLGLSYYENSPFQARGDVYQMGNATQNNLGYAYNITSRRLLVESKLSYTCHRIYHPYVDVGVGSAFNRAEDYREFGYTTDGYPMSQAFGSHSNTSFTYLAGLGVDVDMSKHVAVGVGYRYADLGKAGLGTTPLQIDTSTLSKNSLTSNEFLFQISAIV